MSGFTEIETYRFDVPSEWYALDLTEAVSPRQVAQDILDDVGHADDVNVPLFRDDVMGLVERLRQESDGLTSAAVLVRTEGGLRVGALVVHAVRDLDEGDTPESYEQFARQALAAGQPGQQNLAVQSWQLECAAGPAVGVVHVLSAREPGEADAWVEERAVYAVFVEGTRQLVQFTFTTADFGTFEDMPSETWSIASTVSVELKENA